MVRQPEETKSEILSVLIDNYPRFVTLNDIRAGIRSEAVQAWLANDGNRLKHVLQALENEGVIHSRNGLTEAAVAYTESEDFRHAMEAVAGRNAQANLTTLKEKWQRELQLDTEYFSTVVSFYSNKATGFGSLFLAIMLGLYTYTAIMPSLRAALGQLVIQVVVSWPALSTYWPFLALLASLFILAGAVLIWISALIISFHYYAYNRLADKANALLYGSRSSRTDFLVNVVPQALGKYKALWNWLHAHAVIRYGCIGTALGFTLFLSIAVWWVLLA
jgi:hypothetical protein